MQHAKYGDRLVLGVGGPRESEAPGIYENASAFLAKLLDHAGAG